MDNDIVISVQNVTKTYPLYNSHADRVKETFHPFRKKYHHPFDALSDVSLEIRRGEMFGIIGQNGSGKSTLLQLVCGIMAPTSGTVAVTGRISALLELGAGFNPEFTGRQNVHINGAILGLKPEEVEARFAEIAAFADIGEFIDQPVKTYSSGMYVRLGFAVQACVDPDVLIVDEALAVGDAHFVNRCFYRLRQLKAKGVTVLFASHDVGAVISMCERALLLEKGKVIKLGRAEEVVNLYNRRIRIKTNEDIVRESLGDKNKTKEEGEVTASSINPVSKEDKSIAFSADPELEERARQTRFGSGAARIVRVQVLDDSEEEKSAFLCNRKVSIRLFCEFYCDIDNINIGYVIRTDTGVNTIGTNTAIEGIKVPSQHAGNKIILEYRTVFSLKEGTYSLSAAMAGQVKGETEQTSLDWIDLAYSFTIGLPPESVPFEQMVLVPHQTEIWQVS